MKLSNKSQALHDLIAPAVAACGVDLWGIEFLPQGKRSLLRIYIDKALNENVEPVLNEDGEVEQGRGIGVQDCVLVTQQVGAMLDVHDPIPWKDNRCLSVTMDTLSNTESRRWRHGACSARAAVRTP